MGKISTVLTRARNYLTNAALAGTLAAGCAAYAASSAAPEKSALPLENLVKNSVVESRRAFIAAQEKEYQESLKKAHEFFNEALKDGYLSLEEQRKIRKCFSDAFSFIDNTLDYARKTGLPLSPLESKFTLSPELNTLYILLDENLKRIDYGVPELEKKLGAEGMPATVERTGTEQEYIVGFLYFVFAAMAWGLIYIRHEPKSPSRPVPPPRDSTHLTQQQNTVSPQESSSAQQPPQRSAPKTYDYIPLDPLPYKEEPEKEKGEK